MKHTPWFTTHNTNPVRNGWYLYYDALWRQQLMAYWTGKRWQWDRYATYEMETYRGDLWCGLTEPATSTIA